MGDRTNRKTHLHGTVRYNMRMTDKLRRVSKIVLLVALGAILLWDLAAQVFGGSNATVSKVVWQLASDVPFVTFLVGFVCGHLFWGDPNKMRGPMV